MDKIPCNVMVVVTKGTEMKITVSGGGGGCGDGSSSSSGSWWVLIIIVIIALFHYKPCFCFLLVSTLWHILKLFIINA
jgi:hypothetical protein